jgi:mitogen-activated protein kinase 1/3
MDTTLSRILKSRQALTEEHFQYFSLQLLEAVKAMHAIGIVHTDLKPDHIYLTKNCDLRIGGFRSVQLEGTVHDCNDHRREYGLTRWYRSPEILLNTMMPYAPSMDMFTVGCILGEMYLRLPLFPGSDYIDQITRICKFTGYAEHEDIGVGDLVPRTQAFLHKHCIFPKADLKATFPTAGAQALSLLDALLQLNPARRITAAQALQHEYFAEIEGPHDCSKVSLVRPRADYFAFELDRMDEQQRLTCAQLQGLIAEELKCYATEPDSTLDPLYLPLSCR